MEDTGSKKKKVFVVREFEEVKGGYYDENNFYYTPNGSFWDADGYYFNREGIDKHGGYYDDYFNYIPGKGWNRKEGCYESEIDPEYADLEGDNVDLDEDILKELEKKAQIVDDGDFEKIESIPQTEIKDELVIPKETNEEKAQEIPQEKSESQEPIAQEKVEITSEKVAKIQTKKKKGKK